MMRRTGPGFERSMYLCLGMAALLLLISLYSTLNKDSSVTPTNHLEAHEVQRDNIDSSLIAVSDCEKKTCASCPSCSSCGEKVEKPDRMAVCRTAIKGFHDIACLPMTFEDIKVIQVGYNPDEEFISKQIVLTGAYGQEVGTLLKRFKKGENLPLFVDIGANMGTVTNLAAGLGYKTVSFEPGTANYERLQLTIWVNGFQSTSKAYQFGLGASNSQGFIFFNVDSDGMKSDGVVVSGPDDPLIQQFKQGSRGSNWHLEPLFIAKLDDWLSVFKERIHVLKIDVEGFESFVFSGAKKLFKEQPPKLVVFEVNPPLWTGRHSMPDYMSMKDTFRFLRDCGYTGYHSSPERPIDIENYNPGGMENVFWIHKSL